MLDTADYEGGREHLKTVRNSFILSISTLLHVNLWFFALLLVPWPHSERLPIFFLIIELDLL